MILNDQQALRGERREKRAKDPHYYLTVRIMAAVYQSPPLPLELTRKEAIAMTRSRAIDWKKYCTLNTPNNQTLWFDQKGRVYAITEEGPTMRIGGRIVTHNLLP